MNLGWTYPDRKQQYLKSRQKWQTLFARPVNCTIKTARTIANWCLEELLRKVTEGKVCVERACLPLLVKLASMLDAKMPLQLLPRCKGALPEVIQKVVKPWKSWQKKKNLFSDDLSLVAILNAHFHENEKSCRRFVGRKS